MKLVERIESVEYHRNGVAGRGFTVVTFWHRPEKPASSYKHRRMVAIMTTHATPDEEEEFSREECYVLDTEFTAAGNIGHGNKWRGDNFADELIPLLVARIKAEQAVS